MSLSKECGYCPFDVGFDIAQNNVLTVCGDPSQRCINLRGKLIDQIAGWQRLSEIADHSKSGMLDVKILAHGDKLRFFSSEPEKPYGKEPDRELAVIIDNVGDSGILYATVAQDSYTDTDDLEKQYYAIQENTKIEILGAFERTYQGPEMWDGITIPGEIHVGRFIAYRLDEKTRFGLYIQEIGIISGSNEIGMFLFDTDPSKHRPAPPLRPQ